MPNTKSPARETLIDVARANGWHVRTAEDRRAAFVRGTDYVGVSYSEAGQVRSAQFNTGAGHACGKLVAFVGVGTKAKAAAVAAWLTDN